MTDHQPLPVAGYTPQNQQKVNRVNEHKEAEERLLRLVDKNMAGAESFEDADKRWIAIAKTHFEQGFMALNRAIFNPQRIKLPGE